MTDETAAPESTKPKLNTQNGVTEPRPGSATRRIWDIATAISDENGVPATAGEVKEVAVGEGLNEATIATQYNRWRKFYGIAPQGRAKKADQESETEAEAEDAS